MGTLIGAPLGIALAAGVVLPAMVIGIPVYVGRQVWIKSFFTQLHLQKLYVFVFQSNYEMVVSSLSSGEISRQPALSHIPALLLVLTP